MKAWLAVALILAPSSWAAGVHGSQYQQSGTCGAYPRADVTTAAGSCVGIVAGPDHGLQMPRTILQVGPAQFLIADMGGWVGAKGRVLSLTVNKDGKAAVANVYGGLRQPHGLAMGPDGKIYLGEKGRISRFDPRAPETAMETVASGLPEDGLHPLTNLVFASDGALIVNVGAPTDRCETNSKPSVPQNPCPLTEGDRARAALWKLTFDKPGGKVVKTEVLARGLRNSMALAVDPQSGMLVQGENSVDLPGEDEPVEELNVIKPGAHYGWPSCVGKNAPVPGSVAKAADCAKYEPSVVNLPPHSAPLGMIAYDGAMFPALKGKYVIALHGYRKYGHRLVAIDRSALTIGQQKIEDVVSGWSRKRGLRPMGAPVGLTAASDGAIWFVEDKNRTVMVLLKSGIAAGSPKQAQQADTLPPPPGGWAEFANGVLKTKCAACHVEARETTPNDIWAKMVAAGWAGEGPLADSKLIRALKGLGPEKPMPPPSGLKADMKSQKALERLLGLNP